MCAPLDRIFASKSVALTNAQCRQRCTDRLQAATICQRTQLNAPIMATVKLVPATDAHRSALPHWFPDQRSCAIWAGPDFRYPFTAVTFQQDVRPDLPSFALLDCDDALLGFGQYYLRLGHCHLARLAIAPRCRGRALGAVLIRELCHRGRSALQVTHSSLFVLTDNVPALRLYSRLGFIVMPYPKEAAAIAGCLYMVAPPETINSWE
jgi:ribosomal protein S18 acetylase RimI-like enzyme